MAYFADLRRLLGEEYRTCVPLPGLVLRKGCERAFDSPLVACFKNAKFKSHRLRHSAHVGRLHPALRRIGIGQDRTGGGVRNEFAYHSRPFRREVRRNDRHSSDIAAGARKASWHFGTFATISAT